MPEQKKKTKKEIKVRDLKPKKDAKGGGQPRKLSPNSPASATFLR
jgi:hypothetical protein